MVGYGFNPRPGAQIHTGQAASQGDGTPCSDGAEKTGAMHHPIQCSHQCRWRGAELPHQAMELLAGIQQKRLAPSAITHCTVLRACKGRAASQGDGAQCWDTVGELLVKFHLEQLNFSAREKAMQPHKSMELPAESLQKGRAPIDFINCATSGTGENAMQPHNPFAVRARTVA